MRDAIFYKCRNKNSGMSIVELLVAVAILALVFTPVLNSFIMAAKTNARAQNLQNATSLAEDTMEEIKGKSLSELKAEAATKTNMTFTTGDGSDNYVPPYTISYNGVTATQGTKFDVIATISTDPYSVSDNSEDASDANSFQVPQFYQVDSAKNIVLSWEINSLDEGAMDRLADENAISTNDISTIIYNAKNNGVKTTVIDLSDDSSNKISVTCNVKYSIPGSSISTNNLVYAGTYDERVSGNSGPDVYIFYTISNRKLSQLDTTEKKSKYFKNENIEVHDKTTTKAHNIYLILQDGLQDLKDTKYGSGTMINFKTEGYSTNCNLLSSSAITSSIMSLHNGLDGIANTTDDIKLYTNLREGASTSQGNMFSTNSRIRMYYVKVEVLKDGDLCATYTSTMQPGDEVR